MKIHHTHQILTGSMLVIGSGLTLWGLRNLTFIRRPHHLVFVMLALMLVWSGSRLLSKSPFIIGICLAVCLALAGGALWPLCVALWLALSAALSGRWLLRALGAKGGNGITYFLTGAGIYGSVVGLLAHWPINYPGLYGAALALPLVLGRRIVRRWLMLAKRWFVRSCRANEDISHWLNVFIVAVVLLHFVVALMPELGFDALWMHLFVPAHMAGRHEWGFDVTTYVWAVTPMLGDWLFSIGYLAGGETASRLINISFILALAGQVRELALWSGSSQLGARWVMLIFLTTPLTFTVSTTLFIEPVWAAFIVAGALALYKACFAAARKNTHLILAGILSGCALAAKAVTFTILPALLVVFLWRYKAWLQARYARALMLGTAWLLALGAVPYVTAWILTGNPVFPFFNKVFRSPLWHPINFEAAFGKGVTWDLLYQVVFHTEKYSEATAGAAGFQWLILFLPAAMLVLISRQWRGGTVLFVGVVSVVLAFRSTAYIRYVFPASVMLTAVLGLAMTWSEKSGRLARYSFTVAGIFVTLLNLWFLNAGAFYGDFPWQTLLSETDRREYLIRRLPMRSAVELVNRLNIGQSPVVVMANPQTAGLLADAVYANWTNYTFDSAILTVRTEADAARLFNERNATYAILDTAWAQANEPCVAVVRKACEPLAVLGTVIVLRLKKEYRFGQELIVNGQPANADHWMLTGSAKYATTAGALITNVNSPANQIVQVQPGRAYLHSLEARCYQEKSLARLQINWSDRQGRFLSTDIRVFDCTQDWGRQEMEVVAPPGASQASVYIMSHTSVPVAFRAISFR